MADDELQEARDNFFVGNFQKVLQLCEATFGDDMIANEKGALEGRAFLGMENWPKMKELQRSPIPGQRAAALLAVMSKHPNAQAREQAKEHLMNTAKETADMSVAALAACSLAKDGLWNDAMQMANNHPTLEMQSLQVFLLLICNQVDLAQKRLQSASGQNDDSGAYRLAQAAVAMATGDFQEAYGLYCDLCTQYPTAEGGETGSLLLQTGKAVANMHRGMWSEAVEDLLPVLVEEKPEVNVLINLITCATNLGNSADFAKYYAMLEKADPAHPYVVKTQSLATVFARFAASN